MDSALQFLVGWTRYPLADGAIFVPPEGPEQGLVRIHERLPLRRFRSLIRDMIRDAGVPAEIGPLERWTTLEGEHAGVVSLTTRIGAQTFERTVALVAGDDWSVVVDGGTAVPARFDGFRTAVRQIADSAYLGLGETRQRRFEHRAPAGWAAIPRPHAVRYLHPEYPRIPTVITVHEARPRQLSPSESDDRALMFDSVEESQTSEPPTPLQAAGGLLGQLARFATEDRGKKLVTARAYLGDPRYLYRFQLETAAEHADDAVAMLVAVAGSTRAIPARRARSEVPAVSSHWVD